MTKQTPHAYETIDLRTKKNCNRGNALELSVETTFHVLKPALLARNLILFLMQFLGPHSLPHQCNIVVKLTVIYRRANRAGL